MKRNTLLAISGAGLLAATMVFSTSNKTTEEQENVLQTTRQTASVTKLATDQKESQLIASELATSQHSAKVFKEKLAEVTAIRKSIEEIQKKTEQLLEHAQKNQAINVQIQNRKVRLTQLLQQQNGREKFAEYKDEIEQLNKAETDLSEQRKVIFRTLQKLATEFKEKQTILRGNT